ncbi:MAG TPA: prepilin-type N-terminal cleavage/methylation domain-containing protein [Novimethylophilus sp.]|uniref:prepilin-type N-terminal cleavage/methylation domain-containing protein n=1 Tax=Novimethylophilus sp. TaxID=2137426 RepID=UPI002F416D3B
MKKQTGFTLIELAIVLVIIGLLLGGVLKGQELINSAKVKNMASDFKNVQVFIYGYQDKYKALPGDDANAVAHVGGIKASTASETQGNGVIEGAWNTATDTDESCVFWQHVRLAGLAPGSTTVSCAAGNTYQPKNADGGTIGIQSVSGFTKITGMPGSFVVCSDGILGKFAKQLDTTLDDGETSTGSVRATPTATTGVAATLTSGIIDANNYTVCMTF